LSDVLSKKELVVDGDDNDSFIRHFAESVKSAEKKELITRPVAGADDVAVPPPEEFNREELLYIIRDLLVAGTDTSSATMRWFFISMANHRDIQTRMQKEIDAVVGRDRLPSLNDERLMPYSQAVMLETMRRYTLVPLSVFRSTTDDTAVGEVFVPEKTMVC